MPQWTVPTSRKASRAIGQRRLLPALWSIAFTAGLVPFATGLAQADSENEAGAARPAESATPVSFFQDVRPILQRHCQGCHQPAKKEGGLSVTTVSALMAGGKNGAAVVASKPEESLLLLSLTGEGVALMPKDADPLPEESIAILERWIAEGGNDDSPADARDEISPENPPVYEGRPLITALAFSRDGSTLAVGGYREVLLHHGDGSGLKARLIGLSQRIESLAYSPDGQWLAAVGGSPGRFGEIQIWDVEKQKLRDSYTFTYDCLFGACWSSDGTKLAFGCGDNSTRVIDATTGQQVLRFDHHTDWVLGTAFSVDNKHMITVSRDRAMKLSLTETGSFIDNITSITPGALTGGLEALDRHPTENQVATGGVDGVPKIYRVFREQARKIGDDFNLIRALEPFSTGKVTQVRYSPDGSLLAAAGAGPIGKEGERTGIVRVYQVADGKTVSTVGFDGSVYALSFHPDNKTVAAGGYDGVVKLIDAPTGKVNREFVPVPFVEAANP